MPSFFQNLFKKDSDDLAVAVADNQEADATQLNSLLSAMNLPSPFVVSSEEQFTVRELIMLIPQQFVRHDAMPGDQLVSLPLEALRTSLQQGRPALRLSQIHVACPSLFSRQVLPSEDVEIVLPFQKVKRMVESGAGSGSPALASPFAAVVPPNSPVAGRGESPFASPGSPFSPNASAPQATAASPFTAQRAAQDSPFAARTADQLEKAEVLSPGSSGPVTSQESAAPVNPFQRLDPSVTVPPRVAQSPFQLVAPAAAPASVEAPRPPSVFPPMAPMGSPFTQGVELGRGNGNGNIVGASKVEEFPDIDAPEASAPERGSTSPPEASPFESPRGMLPPQAPGLASALPVRPLPLAEKPALPPLIASPAGTAAEQPKRLRVSLASLLRDVTADDLGFDPTAVPGNVDAELFYDTILPQLATGRVEVSIEELRAGVVERFRPAFARVKPGLRFVVPLSEIFQNLPSGAIPAPQSVEHVAISTTPFLTPFAIKAGEDQVRAPLPSLSQMITPAAGEPAPMAPFPVAPPIESPKLQTSPVSLPPLLTPPAPSPTEPVTPKLPALPKLPMIPGMSARPSPFARPPGVPPAVSSVVEAPVLPPVAPHSGMPSLPAAESHEDLGHPFSASSLRAEPPVPAPAPSASPVEPFDPARLFSETAPAPAARGGIPVRPDPVSAPAPVESARPLPPMVQPPAPPAAPPAPPVEFNFGETVDFNQTLLRAFFAAAGDLTPHQIVDHLAQLPGLRSCLAIVEGNVISSGHDSGSADVAHFTANAPRAVEYLTGLAGSMNCEGNGSITLRAGATVRTFFMEAGICLAVLHEKPGFACGVREKLILTARALADLTD